MITNWRFAKKHWNAYAEKGSRMFSEKEIQYLKSQRLARIATASVSSEKEDKKGFTIQPDQLGQYTDNCAKE